MTDAEISASYPGVSAPLAAMRGHCPRCGKGRLFKGYLAVTPACTVCGLDYGFTDSGDGPAVFIILIVGVLVVGLALVADFAWNWPYWLIVGICLPLVLVLSIGLLRPLKGWFIGMQYRHKAQEGRRFED